MINGVVLQPEIPGSDLASPFFHCMAMVTRVNTIHCQ